MLGRKGCRGSCLRQTEVDLQGVHLRLQSEDERLRRLIDHLEVHNSALVTEEAQEFLHYFSPIDPVQGNMRYQGRVPALARWHVGTLSITNYRLSLGAEHSSGDWASRPRRVSSLKSVAPCGRKGRREGMAPLETKSDQLAAFIVIR